MIQLPITATIASLLGLIMFPLTLRISMRRKYLGENTGELGKYTFGDAGDEVLRNRIRAFGNFVEYVPIVLIMLTLIEIYRAPTTLCWILGGAFVLGRLIHAISMSVIPFKPIPRGISMMMTYPSLIIPAIWLLYSIWIV